MRLTWQKETTIYYGEPYFQVMAQQEFSAPVIIITTNTLYELYLNVMPARILQEVSWYVLPATSSHATFQQLEELLGFVTEKEYPEVILLGFGPNSILQLTMSLAKMLASCQELWLFPQDQEGPRGVLTKLHWGESFNLWDSLSSYTANEKTAANLL